MNRWTLLHLGDDLLGQGAGSRHALQDVARSSHLPARGEWGADLSCLGLCGSAAA